MTSPKTQHQPSQVQYPQQPSQQNFPVLNQNPQQMQTSRDQVSEAVISQAVSQAISQASQQDQLQMHQKKQNHVEEEQHQQQVYLLEPTYSLP